MRRALLLAGLCAVGALSACGGGSSTTSDATTQWQNRVNAVCHQNALGIRRAAMRVAKSGAKGKDALADVVQKAIPLEHKTLARLRKIPAPENLKAGYRKFLRGISQELPLFHQLAADLRAGRKNPKLNKARDAIDKRTRPFAVAHMLGNCLPSAPGSQ
jgi:hypothetical protein